MKTVVRFYANSFAFHLFPSLCCYKTKTWTYLEDIPYHTKVYVIDFYLAKIHIQFDFRVIGEAVERKESKIESINVPTKRKIVHKWPPRNNWKFR